MNVDDISISFGVSIVLVALAAVHIGEEAAKGFRYFLNTSWFEGSENCPVSRKKGLFIDQIGLFLLLASLAVAGALFYAPLFLVAVGIIFADLVQHLVFSIAKKGYTPGVATSALYLLFVVGFFVQKEGRGFLAFPWVWGAMAGGASIIAVNYALASWKVHAGACRMAGV